MLVIWKAFPGYPKYQISELGDVRVLKQIGINRGVASPVFFLLKTDLHKSF